MKDKDLEQWLKDQQSIVEDIIMEAASVYINKHESLPNFGYDLQQAQAEAYNLSKGSDLCYDRISTPLAYSLWYQARRINVFLTHFYKKIAEGCNSAFPVDIFDLGAGTGCVQLCVGLVYVYFARAKKGVTLLRIINVDSSPFMLEYLRAYLWPVAIKYYPEMKKMPVEYNVYSWSNKGDMKVTNPWLCASYLFDSSDNEEYLASNFEELANAFDPAKIMFLTSAQSRKEKLLTAVTDKMKALRYQMTPSGYHKHLFSGTLQKVDEYRNKLIEQYQLKASAKPVSWTDSSFHAIGLEKTQTGFIFDTRDIPQELSLYIPPLKIRRDVALNEDQKKAASFENTPSIITGPAGCGKSVVITEKILNILEQYQWAKNLEILVTTFNKGLIRQLRYWVTDLLQSRNKKFKNKYYKTYNGENDGTGEIIIGDQYIIRIKFIHFEMLAKYLGNIQYKVFDEKRHVSELVDIIQRVRNELQLDADELTDVLSPEFLLEEYHRVIYGLQCKLSMGEQAYQEIARTGRGTKPRLERGNDRKAVWLALYKYGLWMHTNPKDGQSFLARRQLFLNKLSNNEINDLFDYIFVDEFQDCTPADYKIMAKMLKDVNNLILAGDLAQAVHIGQSGKIPRDEDMNRRKFHKLKGSYRLPYRISEAIAPLSHNISNSSDDKELTVEITPYKGAPPGARPIIVYANDNASLAEKILAIKSSYSLFDLNHITILEKDEDLCNTITARKHAAETTTILKLKGLEKEFVVWSLQAEIFFEKELREFAYTIMTRTNCILLIAITPLYKMSSLEIVNQLRYDRLIYWDEETNIFMMKAKSDKSSNVSK